MKQKKDINGKIGDIQITSGVKNNNSNISNNSNINSRTTLLLCPSRK